MPKAVNNAVTATKPTPAKGVVKRKRKTTQKLKKLKKQLDESYTLLLGSMLLSIFQEVEDDAVRQARASMDEFRHIMSEGATSDPVDGALTTWSEVSNAVKEAWRVFLAGDKSAVWKTFISGCSSPVPVVEKTEVMVTDPDQSYYDQCVEEDQSQPYDPMAELDAFFEDLKTQPPQVDTTFSQVAAV